MTGARRPSRRKLDTQVDRVMGAAQVLVAVAVQSGVESTAQVGGRVTLSQLRVLVLVQRHEELSLAAVAAGLGVHASTASRTCDPLVRAGLLSREDHPADRRRLALTLTPAGRRLVDSMLMRRREAVEEVLRRLPAARREAVADALADFTAAAGDPPDDRAVTLGWTP